MKTAIECIPCFFKQALEAARLAQADEQAQKKILIEISRLLPELSYEQSPPEVARVIHKLIRQQTGKKDPYLKIKKESNRRCLAVYPQLLKKVAAHKDKLFMALELSIAGNIIDYGVKNSLNVEEELDKIISSETSRIKQEAAHLFEYDKFKELLDESKHILFLGDNAGEIVFDRVLIETIKELDRDKQITYAARGAPIINDALLGDVRECSLDETADIITTGLDAPGVILDLCSRDFLKTFNEADMVISKGQGNYEALDTDKANVFFLFMAKCPVVAGQLNCDIGDIILLSNKTIKALAA